MVSTGDARGSQGPAGSVWKLRVLSACVGGLTRGTFTLGMCGCVPLPLACDCVPLPLSCGYVSSRGSGRALRCVQVCDTHQGAVCTPAAGKLQATPALPRGPTSCCCHSCLCSWGFPPRALLLFVVATVQEGAGCESTMLLPRHLRTHTHPHTLVRQTLSTKDTPMTH